MFESLDEHIKHDVELETPPAQRWLRVLGALVLAAVVFVGLYFGIRLLE